MKENPIKKKLAGGELVLGTMVFEFATTGIARLAAAAGAEFVIYDMEHTGWSHETIRMLLATSGDHVVPIVRPAANQYQLIAPALDLGAMGIMVPMVGTADAARDFVASTKYPPAGRRGAAFGVAHDDYAGGDIAEKIRSSNAEILTIAQIETTEGLANVDEIAAVEGLDMLFMGQMDLTNFLGIPGRYDDPRFTEATELIAAAAQRNNKALGMLATSVTEAERWIERGFRCIAYGGDLWLYRQALAEGLARLRS